MQQPKLASSLSKDQGIAQRLIFIFGRCIVLTREEVGQVVALGPRRGIDIGTRIAKGLAKGFGQPAGIHQQALRLLGHLARLAVSNQISRAVARARPHGLEDARLGPPTEVVRGRRPSTRRDHVEARFLTIGVKEGRTRAD